MYKSKASPSPPQIMLQVRRLQDSDAGYRWTRGHLKSFALSLYLCPKLSAMVAPMSANVSLTLDIHVYRRAVYYQRGILSCVNLFLPLGHSHDPQL